MEKKFKVYGLKCSCSDDCKDRGIRYIGVTRQTLKKRLSGHKSAATNADFPVSRWIRKHGKTNIVITLLYAFGDEREMYICEAFLIPLLRASWGLLNVLDSDDINNHPWVDLRTHCPQGHPYSGDNLYIDPSTGGRTCKTCRADHNRNRNPKSQYAPKVTYCPNGHEYTEENTIIEEGRYRKCRTCLAERSKERGRKRREETGSFYYEASGPFKPRKTHCVNGHEYTPENTNWYKRTRSCRTCVNDKQRARYHANKVRIDND